MEDIKIKKYRPKFPNGYINNNRHLSEIHKIRIGLANKGKIRSEENKQRISIILTGKKQSKETIEKRRLKNLGRICSEETKIKIGLSNKGKIRSLEERKRISEKKKIAMKNKELIEKIKIYRAKQIFPLKDTSIELKIQSYLKQLNIDFFTHQYIKEIEHGYQCDILIPSINLVIECDGDYWHKYPIGTEIDKIRTSELISKGFKVLRLWEHEIKVMELNEFKNRLIC
jgi:very-short-patch-repair endonuclease